MENTSIKRLYYSISEVSKLVDEEQYVLRYWETEFEQLRPQKNRAGNRVYNENDVEVIRAIQHLLRIKRHTIEGAKEHLQAMKFTFDTSSNDTDDKLDGGISSAVQNSSTDSNTDTSDSTTLAPSHPSSLSGAFPNGNNIDSEPTVEQGTPNEDMSMGDHSSEPYHYTFSQAASVAVPQDMMRSVPILAIPLPSASETAPLDRSTDSEIGNPSNHNPSTVVISPLGDSVEDVTRPLEINPDKTIAEITLSEVQVGDNPILSSILHNSEAHSPKTHNSEVAIKQEQTAQAVQFSREELVALRDTLLQMLHLLEKPNLAQSLNSTSSVNSASVHTSADKASSQTAL